MAFMAVLYEAESDKNQVDLKRTQINAHVSPDNKLVRHVVVHALSPTEIVMECHDNLENGDCVTINIPGLPTRMGRITAKNGIIYDCTFDVPLAAHDVTRKLLRTKVVWPEFSSSPEPQATLPWKVSRFADPYVARWAGPVRLCVIAAGALLCWAPLIAGLQALFS